MRPQNTIVLPTKYYFLVVEELPKLGNFNIIQFFPSNFKNCQTTNKQKKYLLPNTSLTYYNSLPILYSSFYFTYYKTTPPIPIILFWIFFFSLHLWNVAPPRPLLNFISFFFAQVLSSSQNFNVQLSTKKHWMNLVWLPSIYDWKNISFYCCWAKMI